MTKQKTAPPAKKKKSSPDYPLLARKIVEASWDAAVSKLPAALYIVATPIGHRGDISLRALLTLATADRIACEDTRVSGGLLTAYGIKKPLLPYHDHNADHMRPEILARIEAGEAVALISDAGMPLIADPGFKLVRACRKAGLGVTVIPGANAALTALAGSGLPTDQFYFTGFLPAKSAARQTAIIALRDIPSTLVFFETAPRLAAALGDLKKILGPRPAAVARELTKLFEETRRGTLGELAIYYREHPVKGEIVIIIGAPEQQVAIAEADLDGLLKKSLRTLSLRDAVAAVSDMTGVKKSGVYARALRLKGGK